MPSSNQARAGLRWRSARPPGTNGTLVPGVMAMLLMLCLSGCATTPSEGESTAVGEPSEVSFERAVREGDLAATEERYHAALKSYVRALVQRPDDVAVYHRIARIHHQLGRLDEATSAYREILKVRPDDPAAMEGLGRIFLAQRRKAEAREMLLKALNADPSRWRTLNALGILEDLSGDHATAQDYYRKGLTEAPKTAELLNNLAYSLYLDGEWAVAETYLDEALSVAPDHEQAWSNLGMLHVRQGRHGEALDAFEKIMPTAAAHNSVGYVCMITNDHKCARDHFARAIAASPVYYEEAEENLDAVQRTLESRRRGQ